MKSIFTKTALVYLVSSFVGLGCSGSQQSAEPPATPESGAAETASPVEAAPEPAAAEPAAGGKTVDVELQAKSGSKLSGKATLTETAEGVKVTLSVENVSPGDHGAHVHEKGDCSAADGSSAGEHFNPTSNPHALPSNDARHLGDLGNVSVGADGKGSLEITVAGANMKDGDPSSFLGKAIIVHEKKDDGGQPSGNAGGRIGCAEIK